MSTGPGRIGRVILDSLADLPPGSGVYVVPDDATRAESNAYRRAAHTLADGGRVRLELSRSRGRIRLAAFPA